MPYYWPDLTTVLTQTKRCLKTPRCTATRHLDGPYCVFHSRGCEVRPSTIHGAGLGLFATVDFPADVVVGRYYGPLVSKAAGSGLYLFATEYPDTLVDGQREDTGLMRYINDGLDSLPSNVVAEVEGCRIWIVTSRRIARGEEFFLTYGTASYWSMDDDARTKSGAAAEGSVS